MSEPLRAVCADCGAVHALAGGDAAESALRVLLATVDARPDLSSALTAAGGKMLGVLLTETAAGPTTLWAHSGSVATALPEFVPTVLDRSRLREAEAETLAALSGLDQAIAALPLAEARAALDAARTAASDEAMRRRARFQLARIERAARRAEAQGAEALAAITRDAEATRREEKAAIARERTSVEPHQAAVQRLKQAEAALVAERRERSARLMAQFHAAVTLMSRSGRIRPLPEVFAAGLQALGLPPRGVPTGTGECCAPKLLDAAARRGLRPVALAEAWWEPAATRAARPDHGELKSPCDEKCLPILGFLLCDASEP